MRINPNARLDPSQVEGLDLYRNRHAIRRYHDMQNRWPFLTMEQRYGMLQNFLNLQNATQREGMPALPRSPWAASSIPAWFTPPPPSRGGRLWGKAPGRYRTKPGYGTAGVRG